jgi:hypothetical protein
VPFVEFEIESEGLCFCGICSFSQYLTYDNSSVVLVIHLFSLLCGIHSVNTQFTHSAIDGHLRVLGTMVLSLHTYGLTACICNSVMCTPRCICSQEGCVHVISVKTFILPK